jgi:hypothetical protein
MTATLVPSPPELSTDRRFGGRVRRLVAVSSVALGLIALLAWASVEPPVLLMAALVAGWVSMPLVLAASLRRPYLRYLLVVPAGLVSAALVTIVAAYLPPEGALAIAGWLLITAGVLTGGSLGMWFWYRWLPVPGGCEDPFGRARLALIGLHVGLVVIGMALVALSLL